MAELNQIRRLNKKLRQIERLEGARRKLTLEERTKVVEIPVPYLDRPKVRQWTVLIFISERPKR